MTTLTGPAARITQEEEMNYRQELNRHEEQIQTLTKTIKEQNTLLRQQGQAILELDTAFRSAGLSADGGVGSLPSPSEDLRPAEQSADTSATIQT